MTRGVLIGKAVRFPLGRLCLFIPLKPMSDLNFYQKLYRIVADPLRGNKRGLKTLIFVEKTLVGVSMTAYAALVFYALFWLDFAWQNLVCVLCLPAACLFAVSVLRRAIKRKRPYEEKIVPLVEKDAQGNSFPSRHTACAFVIATVALAYFPLAGGLLYAVGVWIAFFRFLFGHHYPTDLLGGIVLGFLFGCPAFFLI